MFSSILNGNNNNENLCLFLIIEQRIQLVLSQIFHFSFLCWFSFKYLYKKYNSSSKILANSITSDIFGSISIDLKKCLVLSHIFLLLGVFRIFDWVLNLVKTALLSALFKMSSIKNVKCCFGRQLLTV